MVKPSLKIFQQQSPTSSTEQQPTEPLYSYVTQTYMAEEVATSHMAIGISLDPKSAARFQAGQLSRSNSLAGATTQTDVLSNLPPNPTLAWRQLGAALMSPETVAEWEKPLPKPPAAPTPEGSQFHLVHVPDLGFPNSEIYDKPRDLIRALKYRLREAADSLALNQHTFFVFRGVKGVVYFDEMTYDVAVEIDGKKLRPRLERLDDMTALQNGQMPGAGEKGDETETRAGSWEDAMGIELFDT